MDGFSEMLSKVLSDPESMSAIRSMAQQFASDDKKERGEREETPSVAQTLLGVPAISRALHLLSNGSRERIDLLCALRPFIREEKRSRLDTVISTMKTLDLLCAAEKLI